MYCQKCKFTSFDHYEKCPKCSNDWSEKLKEFNLAWIQPSGSAWFQDDQSNMGSYTQNIVKESPTEEKDFLLEENQDSVALGSENTDIEFETKNAQKKDKQTKYEKDSESHDFDFLQSGAITDKEKAWDLLDDQQTVADNANQDISLLKDQESQSNEDEALVVPGLEDMFSSEKDTSSDDFTSAKDLEELIQNEEDLDLLSEFEVDSFDEEINEEQKLKPSPETELDEIIIPEEDLNFTDEPNSDHSTQNTEPENQEQTLAEEQEEIDIGSISELETMDFQEETTNQKTEAEPDSLQQNNEQESDMFDLYLGEEEEEANLEDIEIELDFEEDETDKDTENEK